MARLIRLVHSKLLKREHSTSPAKESHLTITPIKWSAREEEFDAAISEEFIDSEVKKTKGLYKCDDCNFTFYVQTEIKNNTKINHIDLLQVIDQDCT